jgi:hypothetical protein
MFGVQSSAVDVQRGDVVSVSCRLPVGKGEVRISAVGAEPFPFEVIRDPSARKLCELVQWCELFFHNNVSLRMAWPLLFIRRPWAIAHHTWISEVDGRVRMRDRGKLLLLRFARNIAVSQAARRLPSISPCPR